MRCFGYYNQKCCIQNRSVGCFSIHLLCKMEENGGLIIKFVILMKGLVMTQIWMNAFLMINLKCSIILHRNTPPAEYHVVGVWITVVAPYRRKKNFFHSINSKLIMPCLSLTLYYVRVIIKASAEFWKSQQNYVINRKLLMCFFCQASSTA